MNISIDASGLGAPKTGTTVYLAQILAHWNQNKSLNHHFTVFVAPKAARHLLELGLDARFTLLAAPNHKLLRVLWQQTLLPLHLKRLGIQVHWGPGFVLPLWCHCPAVVTIHDLTFQLFPAAHEPIKRYYFPFMIRRSVQKASKVLVISRTTMADLERIIPGSSAKAQLTLLAARPLPPANPTAQATQPAPPTTAYVLFVGTLEPRKNLTRLIQAWCSLPPTARGHTQLLVVGANGWMLDHLQSTRKPSDNVQFMGSLSDETLAHHLRSALFFVYPSLYEGFGLPVLEAMSVGTPVLTSNLGALQEVAGHAAWLVNPHSQASIAQGLARLLQDPQLRASLRTAGLRRAAQFNWANTAHQTWQALQTAAQP